MDVEQEPKYTTDAQGRIVNRATGQAIPDDEPVFILRAKDRQAVHALQAYLRLCSDPQHRAAVINRIVDFNDFATQNPDRMQEPTTHPQNGRGG